MDFRALFVLTPMLAACATSVPSNAPGTDQGADSQFKDIATTPLSDLNLVRAKIPKVLLAAQKAPYGMPEARSCAALSEQVKELDDVLGPDLDARPATEQAGMVERCAGFVGEAAVDAARGAAAGILPFRSWIRKLSGAERHSREVAAAIAAGIVRRAYLKGLGQAGACQPPAAPGKPEAAAGSGAYSSGTKPSETELRQ